MTVLEKPRYSPRQGEEAKKALLYRRQNDFWWFRRHVRPEMLTAWWQQDVARHLNSWFQDFKLGKRPKLVLQSPPQHGKSEQVRDFVASLLGNNRGLKIIFTTYSDELGMATNLALQRMLGSPEVSRGYLLATRFCLTTAAWVAAVPGRAANAEVLPWAGLPQRHLLRLASLPPSFPLPFSSLGLAPLLHVGIGHAERADGFDAEGVALLLREAQPPRQGGRLVPDRIVDDVAGDR